MLFSGCKGDNTESHSAVKGQGYFPWAGLLAAPTRGNQSGFTAVGGENLHIKFILIFLHSVVFIDYLILIIQIRKFLVVCLSVCAYV